MYFNIQNWEVMRKHGCWSFLVLFFFSVVTLRETVFDLRVLILSLEDGKCSLNLFDLLVSYAQ